MVGHERDQSPQLVDLASINEIPGNMPGKSFLCGTPVDSLTASFPRILNSSFSIDSSIKGD
jgi:hypothetical protein